MSVERSFFDTNILLYLHSADTVKADRAEALVRAGGVIGIQVLNEMTSVLRRKLGYSWTEVNHVMDLTERLLQVEPLTLDVHRQGRVLAARYSLQTDWGRRDQKMISPSPNLFYNLDRAAAAD